ncbi:MAG: DUF2442 domain-containing protein, partial [Pseudohongiellaceae bacterium]
MAAIASHTLKLQWADGSRGAIDLTDTLARKTYAPLRDKKRFSKVRLGDWGHSVVWPGKIELGA